ncbi:hypothetical protein PInf_016898 [Phytophthora infestans]|nr:hypothetical protein PInf_016898 [Phytophthora infestans]
MSQREGNKIVIGADGNAKVTDFGLSSVTNAEEREQVYGAVQSVAPECLGADVPWGDMEKSVVEYKVKKLRELPSRPLNSTEDQWELVMRMCENEPLARAQIIAVVDELEKFAKQTQRSKELESSEEKGADLVSVRAKMKLVVAKMKQLTADFDPNVSHKVVLARIYRQLWYRIERAVRSSKREDSVLWLDAEFVAIIDVAFDSTKRALADSLLFMGIRCIGD